MDRVPGYEPVGRRFESCVARQSPFSKENGLFLFSTRKYLYSMIFYNITPRRVPTDRGAILFFIHFFKLQFAIVKDPYVLTAADLAVKKPQRNGILDL